MKREVIIISPFQDEIFERVLTVDKNNQLERHAVGGREFLKQECLDYEGYEEDAFYTLAVYLISLGYLVFQAESVETSIIYLPEKISKNQYDWYCKNKKTLRRIRLAIVDKMDGRIMPYDQNNLYEEKPYKKLREIIEEKEVLEYENKQVK